MSQHDTRGITNTKTDTRSEVGKLIREGADDVTVLQKIKEKHGDKDMIDRVFSQYENRMNTIKNKANKFAHLILTKYNNLSTHRIMEKARKLKKKYDFSDDEFHAFVNIALNDKNIARNNIYNVPNTPMSRTLGYVSEVITGRLNYKPEDAKYLSEILTLHQNNLTLHTQVIAQSLIYRDMAPEALTGRFDRSKNNPYNYIHPVVAALFFPRIKYVDEHMLLGSISNIVVHKNNGTPIRTQPDYELYYDMITDPNELSCSSARESPIQDLLQRTKLQIELWKMVRDLRNGRYYPSDIDAANFAAALDNCKTGIFDSPDMAFVRDEGTILRKLMGAFSLRPTIVSITPFGGTVTLNYPMQSYALTQVTSIPIVNYRLPLNIRNQKVRVDLRDALEQPDTYVENKMIVTKMKNIIYSRDFIVFYVNRRYQNINFARLVAPYNFSMLPTSVSGFETINETDVTYSNNIVIGEELFTLRSVVMIEKSCFNRDPLRDQVREIIVGSSAGLIVPEDIRNGRTTSSCLIYDPQSAAIKSETSSGSFEERTPITWVPCSGGMYQDQNSNVQPFDQRAGTRGTIYIFVKPDATAFCKTSVC